MHNVAVEKAIAYYRDNRFNEIRTLDDIKCLLLKYADAKEGNTAAAQYLVDTDIPTLLKLPV